MRFSPNAVAALLLLASLAGCRTGTGPLTEEVVLTLDVAPSRVPCTGIGVTECLQVREPPDGSWQRFYDEVAGFTYEPGYWYVLRVARRPVANPPADGSSLAYRLLTVVSRTPASP